MLYSLKLKKIKLKGQLKFGKSLVSILFITLYTEELFTVPFTRISNLFFSGKKLSCRRLCSKKMSTRFFEFLKKYFAPYVGAQTLVISSTFNFTVLLAQKTTVFLILMITEDLTYPEKE